MLPNELMRMSFVDYPKLIQTPRTHTYSLSRIGHVFVGSVVVTFAWHDSLSRQSLQNRDTTLEEPANDDKHQDSVSNTSDEPQDVQRSHVITSDFFFSMRSVTGSSYLRELRVTSCPKKSNAALPRITPSPALKKEIFRFMLFFTIVDQKRHTLRVLIKENLGEMLKSQ